MLKGAKIFRSRKRAAQRAHFAGEDDISANGERIIDNGQFEDAATGEPKATAH